ncbi:MAG: DUF72 domain-containing protein [Candidatus Eisenbacteria sp.]|nr:DUF72 domain-containing protein [Candidatus Eisenbacteria bacterium]
MPRRPDDSAAPGRGAQPDLFLASRTPGKIRVGTSGFSFPDWVGPFYPPGTRRGGMLDYYQRAFSTVEINATYYRLPPPSTMRRMAERTPADFQFMVKLPGATTHRRDRDSEPVTGFRRTIAPLQEAGKFTGALAQFPFSFRRSADAEAYLAWVRDAFPGMPLFVEFRHSSWQVPELADFLASHDLGFCSVDEPDLPGLIPCWPMLTGDVAYVRLHGRNARDWWQGGSERYHYRYSDEELAEWAATIRNLADEARQTYVFFNNCHAGHAVVNARMMEELLKLA